METNKTHHDAALREALRRLDEWEEQGMTNDESGGMTNDESRFARNDESKSPSNPEGNSYSSSIIRHSSFITRHSSFITRHSSSIIRHSPSMERPCGPSASFKKIAAIFLAAAFLGSLTWAISPLIRQKEKAPRSAGVSTLPLEGERGGGLEREGGLLLFADVRLDSMLAIVSQHYGKAVFFGEEQLRGLHIHTKWNPEDSLAAFIENLNELDELSLTEQRDTIFVQKGGAQ